MKEIVIQRGQKQRQFLEREGNDDRIWRGKRKKPVWKRGKEIVIEMEREKKKRNSNRIQRRKRKREIVTEYRKGIETKVVLGKGDRIQRRKRKKEKDHRVLTERKNYGKN